MGIYVHLDKYKYSCLARPILSVYNVYLFILFGQWVAGDALDYDVCLSKQTMPHSIIIHQICSTYSYWIWAASIIDPRRSRAAMRIVCRMGNVNCDDYKFCYRERCAEVETSDHHFHLFCAISHLYIYQYGFALACWRTICNQTVKPSRTGLWLFTFSNSIFHRHFFVYLSYVRYHCTIQEPIQNGSQIAQMFYGQTYTKTWFFRQMLLLLCLVYGSLYNSHQVICNDDILIDVGCTLVL